MAEFTIVPDYGATEDSAPRVLSAGFGDGYVQRSPDGLNSLLRTWTWSFTEKNISEATAIIDFFKSKAGVLQFTHDLPASNPVETVYVICSSWNKRWTAYGTYTVVAKFEEQVPT